MNIRNKTRRCPAILLAVSMLLSLAACGGGTETAPRATSMHLTRTEGAVNVFDGDGQDVPVLENLGLYSGYGAHTGSVSYAWINLDDVKLTKMDQDSEIAIRQEGKALEIGVKSGSLFFNVTEPLEDDETMDISVSTMMIGIRGTCGWVEENGGLPRVYLLGGKVECSAGEQTVQVSAGEMAELTQDGELVVEPFTEQDLPVFVLEEVGDDELPALEDDTPNPEEYLALADDYIRAGEYDKALEILEEGRELLPDSEEINAKIQEFTDGIITDSSGTVAATVVYDEAGTQMRYIEPVHIPAGASLSDALNGIDAEYVVLDGDVYRTAWEIIVNDLHDVTILGSGEGTQILADNLFDVVLWFKNCENVTLRNIVLGHDPSVTDYLCPTGVLYFENSTVNVIDCDIFGCGRDGFVAIGGEVYMERSVIRDCSGMILALNACKASFVDCSFSGNGYNQPSTNAIWLSQYGSIMWMSPENEMMRQDFDLSFEASFQNCVFTDNQNPSLYGKNGNAAAVFEDCTFSGNTWGD